MIKKAMYFKDEKQAMLISKVNDTIHKKRGVEICDYDNEWNPVYNNYIYDYFQVLQSVVTRIKDVRNITRKNLNALSLHKVEADIQSRCDSITREVNKASKLLDKAKKTSNVSLLNEARHIVYRVANDYGYFVLGKQYHALYYPAISDYVDVSHIKVDKLETMLRSVRSACGELSKSLVSLSNAIMK